MTKQNKHYTQQDYKIYQLCSSLGSMSTCKDKQVGAVIVDEKGLIVGSGYNMPHHCNNLCNKTCSAIHAEFMAIGQLPIRDSVLFPGSYTAYINLYPCKNCQESMRNRGITTVKVFGIQGNKWDYNILDIELIPDLPSLLLSMNGPSRCRQIMGGEMAELITAISNLDARDDRPETRDKLIQDMIDEYVDVQLQLQIFPKGIRPYQENGEGMAKWNKLLDKFWSKFFTDIDL